MQTPTLDPAIAMYLMETYPGVRREGLRNMWLSAWSWVADELPPHTYGHYPATHWAVHSAALFRLRAICEQDPKRKAAFMFSAAEALAPVRR